MIVLDTNVVSEMARPHPDPVLEEWVGLESRPLRVSAVTIAEIEMGLAVLPLGRRRRMLTDILGMVVDDILEGRIVDFTRAAATEYGKVVAGRRAVGRPISIPDAQIAASCRALGASLATRNVRDFEETGVDLLDPWAIGSP